MIPRVPNFAPKFSVTSAALVLVLTLLSTLAAAQLKIGSSNTATADPTVPHPNTTPCKVVLFSHYKFANFNAQNFPYAPPSACPGPWAEVVLSADFSISEGVQYDRTANIWIGPTNVYFGTTSEDDLTARNWHIERNLTDYSSIFTVPQTGTVDLGNLVNSMYTGVLWGSATLYFYPLAPNQPAPRTADQVIAFSGGPDGGTVGLDTSGQCCQTSLAVTQTFPTNIESIFFDVFSQSQHDDEFWYSCFPNNIASEFDNCGYTAFRESEITIDGTPAGVAPVYPWIYSGGIDPFLWRPTPGVQTLNFKPYRVNLTPFAATLNDGNPHTIALSVFNADDYFSATAALLLYLDANSTQVTGGVTTNTLTAPNPNVVEKLHTSSNGNVAGTINTTSGHNFEISGYANTSHGIVTTTVRQNIEFSNFQYIKSTDTEFVQNITQGTKVNSVVTVNSEEGTRVTTVNRDWPLLLDFVVQVASDGSETQTTNVNQFYEADDEVRLNGIATSFGETDNRVISADTLNFDSSGNFTGNTNASSSQNYFASDSTGYCYSRDITSAANVLTSITNGVGCN